MPIAEQLDVWHVPHRCHGTLVEYRPDEDELDVRETLSYVTHKLCVDSPRQLAGIPNDRPWRQVSGACTAYPEMSGINAVWQDRDIRSPRCERLSRRGTGNEHLVRTTKQSFVGTRSLLRIPPENRMDQPVVQ
jgi:hypothetical protein